MAMTETGKALAAIAEQLESIEGAAVTELPAVTASDNGKILKVAGGEWTAGAETVELPAVTSSDAGKVLTVSATGEWVAAALPS